MAAGVRGGPCDAAAPGLSAGARGRSQSGGLGPGVPPPHRSDSRPFAAAGDDRHLSIVGAGLAAGLANHAERSAAPPYVDRPDRAAPGHPQLRGRLPGDLGPWAEGAAAGIPGRPFRHRSPPRDLRPTRRHPHAGTADLPLRSAYYQRRPPRPGPVFGGVRARSGSRLAEYRSARNPAPDAAGPGGGVVAGGPLHA